MTPELERAQARAAAALTREQDARADELADLRRRLLEAEQLLAELPELRERSRRLTELESSPLVRAVVGARGRAQLRAGRAAKEARRDFKRVLATIVGRLAGRDGDSKPDAHEQL